MTSCWSSAAIPESIHPKLRRKLAACRKITTWATGDYNSFLLPARRPTHVLNMAEMTRLTRLRSGNVGNLGFLPVEVCIKIYAFLLADFGPWPGYFQPADTPAEGPKHPCHIPHSIDTAILRASRNIHREAYDVMVKRNRFVLFKSPGVLTSLLLSFCGLRVVTSKTEHVMNFKGYVLAVSIALSIPPRPQSSEIGYPFKAMILAKDLEMLCRGLYLSLGEIELGNKLVLQLNLGLVVESDCEPNGYKDLESLERYFTEKTQKELIQPFRTELRDLHNVQVCGRVSDDIAKSALKDMASSKWTSPQGFLNKLSAMKETGMMCFKEDNIILAARAWANAVLQADLVRTGKLWIGFVQEGGDDFINQVAELCFRLVLNMAHLFVRKPTDSADFHSVGGSLRRAERMIQGGFWKKDFTWRPSNELRAKLHFRTALFLRLKGDLRNAEHAMREIDQALVLYPDDPVIQREQQDVLVWAPGANATLH
ncbi:hypothetical protein Daus18300_003388 [Diaporthe australafricana]|uniref:Uncharacterized protein n=1 Tax=Diaporthe australafricana TaxID=127596 RepID=A0ABR3XFZ1_9PEZI